MPEDKGYLSSHVPETKQKETAARGKVKNTTDLDKIKEEIESLREQITKNNRDRLYEMQNIGAKNLSSSFRRSLNGEFVKTNALIQTWADSQEAGFRAVADWQSETDVILEGINGELENFVEEKDIDAYIDGYIKGDEGIASITQAVSGTFVTRESFDGTLEDYAKLTDLPDEDSFVKKTELDAGIETYINGSEGTAAIISAVSGTYVTNEDFSNTLGSYLLSSELNAGISSYLDTDDGKAAVVTSVSGVYVTETNLNETLAGYLTSDALTDYVKTSELDAEIGAYLDGDEGTAKITQAVSGKFLTVDALSGYATTSYVSSSITQEISEFSASLKLSVSNGSESSTIELKNGSTSLSSQTITLSGLVSFTDLLTAGSTTINGANIMTGTISADMIDVTDLKVKQVWFNASIIDDTVILTSAELSSTNLSVRLGVQENNGWAQYLELYGSVIYLHRPGYGTSNLKYSLMVDTVNQQVVPGSTAEEWNLGTADYCFYGIYSFKYYFADGSYLRVSSSGTLRFYDADGDYTDLT